MGMNLQLTILESLILQNLKHNIRALAVNVGELAKQTFFTATASPVSAIVAENTTPKEPEPTT
jgi:hypothetical protein